MKRSKAPLLLGLGCVLAVGMMLYPMASNWLSGQTRSQVITEYETAVEALDNQATQQALELAQAYNRELLEQSCSIAGFSVSGAPTPDNDILTALDPTGGGMLATLEKDTTKSTEEGLLEVYRKLRPGEPPTVESATSQINMLFFAPRRYDLARFGRYKINKKLALARRITGQVAAENVVDPLTGELLIEAGEKITRAKAEQADAAGKRGNNAQHQGPGPDIGHIGLRLQTVLGRALLGDEQRIGKERFPQKPEPGVHGVEAVSQGDEIKDAVEPTLIHGFIPPLDPDWAADAAGE